MQRTLCQVTTPVKPDVQIVSAKWGRRVSRYAAVSLARFAPGLVGRGVVFGRSTRLCLATPVSRMREEEETRTDGSFAAPLASALPNPPPSGVIEASQDALSIILSAAYTEPRAGPSQFPSPPYVEPPLALRAASRENAVAS